MVLKAITKLLTQRVHVCVSIYPGFDTSEPKVKETGNVLQHFDSFFYINTSLICSQIYNKNERYLFSTVARWWFC